MGYSAYLSEIQAESGGLLCANKKDFLRFCCSDYTIVDVDRHVFKDSIVIENMLMNLAHQKPTGGSNTTDVKMYELNLDPLEIPFCAFDFRKFLDFCLQHDPNVPSMTSEDLICSWRVADFFYMPEVKNSIIKELGNIIKTDYISTLRGRLSIKSDYSKVEQDQMWKEGLDPAPHADYLDVIHES